jgi:hypothetical protein
MTVDHLKMLHTAGGKGTSLVLVGPLSGGAADAGQDWCSPCLLFLWGWGENSVWLPVSTSSAAHRVFSSEFITPAFCKLS